ncbi:hypothetical protein BT63DRAFT_260991 [Microthyrium microscopicum]|uniref:FAD-binding PCMH-type domain-containing protein n=1 Tax=Microthyrium microscopicum TaxID=703497 RepID=A0A6A6UCR9_9PEZI|nr:hypothetical protein BT63DRAFT_260991 [Microthyrium microscopicum]
MYGMKPKRKFIEQALEMLTEEPQQGMVVIFHREVDLQLEGLVCHRTASYPTGVVSVRDEDKVIDEFAPFVAGYILQNGDSGKAVRKIWREECRALGRHEDAPPNHLLFSDPNIMVAFNPHATKLSELTATVPLYDGKKSIKNPEARHCKPAAIVRPTEVQHVQQCVKWAIKHDTGLTIIGGGHSGHCLWPNVVAVDMSAFNQLHILDLAKDEVAILPDAKYLVVAGAGCTTGDIIRNTMQFGVTVPLGARPSVGAGLWLQGGIGHLYQSHGLACDAIVGAVMVSVDSGQVLHIGYVPREHRPPGSVRPENERDLLWAIKGAGTNFGIVVTVIFKTDAAATYAIRNWARPLEEYVGDDIDHFSQSATWVPQQCSMDGYLYMDAGKLHLGISLIEYSTTNLDFEESERYAGNMSISWKSKPNLKIADGLKMFESEMHMTSLHGGHASGKTSSFKRCLFLDNIGHHSQHDTSRLLAEAMRSSPTQLCYIHLLKGGVRPRNMGDIKNTTTAFGNRILWDFACIITGVWPREQDGTEIAQRTVRWVYKVAQTLLPASRGVYSADLGPDPRDVELAVKAFGPNRPRLIDLKDALDPHNVLAYACPFPKTSMRQRLIVLVTGESGVGKDYCANAWASDLIKSGFTARVASISDAIKRQYAKTTGSDLSRLLSDRGYKEQHRLALTEFFQKQVLKRPELPAENFLDVVSKYGEVDVLFITGMRDDAPVATFSHLIPESKVVDYRIKCNRATRRSRGVHVESDGRDKDIDKTESGLMLPKYLPTLIYINDETRNMGIYPPAKAFLYMFLHEKLQRLGRMVNSMSDFPRPGVEFRHVLGIAEAPGGLNLCASLLEDLFGSTGDWTKVDAIVSCEAGGFVFASTLASRLSDRAGDDKTVVLIREAGKIPPPAISVAKPASNISSRGIDSSNEKRIEIGRDVIPRGASVVVVDDVLATGRTLCAVLELLGKVGIDAEKISVMVVAEFPVHRGRELLRQRGFGKVNVQSLLVFGGE